MAIEAPLCKYKKTNLKLYIAFCLAVAVFFGYDGYLSKYKWSKRYDFYKKHVIDNDGKPTSTMNFNRKSPPFFVAAAVLLGAYLIAIKNRKIIADENKLIIPSTSLRTGSGKEEISYDSIRQINKTYFGSKGFFVITYKDNTGREVKRKLSDRTYDNLITILDELVAKIS